MAKQIHTEQGEPIALPLRRGNEQIEMRDLIAKVVDGVIVADGVFVQCANYLGSPCQDSDSSYTSLLFY